LVPSDATQIVEQIAGSILEVVGRDH